MPTTYFQAGPSKVTTGTLIRASAYNSGKDVLEQSFSDVEDELISQDARITSIQNIESDLETIRDEAAVLAFNGNPNLIINGNFDVSQQRESFIFPFGAVPMTSGMKPYDMWRFVTDTNDSIVSVRFAHTPGQVDVPGNPRRHARFTCTAGGSGTSNSLRHSVADVRGTQGMQVFHKIWAKADTATSVGLSVSQNFGTGGSPSSAVAVGSATFNLTTAWQRFTNVFTVPSIAGKSLGTDENSRLLLIYELPVNTTVVVDLSSAGLVRGAIDPGDQWRNEQLELSRVRYFTRVYATLPNASDLKYEMRTEPTITGTGPYLADAEVQ